MISKNIRNTQKLAEEAVSQLPSRIFALVGDLGSGKTTFAQFFLRALGVTGRITSPTFVIIKTYKLINLQTYKLVYHIDCYRLKDPAELLNLDFENIVKNKENIVLIEWAEKIKELLPAETKWLYFEHGKGENERIINYENLFNN